MKEKNVTSYSEVADELVHEYAAEHPMIPSEQVDNRPSRHFFHPWFYESLLCFRTVITVINESMEQCFFDRF